MTSIQTEPGQMLLESRFAVLVNRGLALFKSLVAGLSDDAVNRSQAVSHAAKFKLWAGSLGAHRSFGSRSLEYRLRDASFIRNHILSVLQDLSISLITGGSAPPVSGEAPDTTLEELAEYFLDSEEEQEDNMDAIVKSIGHEINCLLRLSVTIRNPAPHDQFKSRAGAEIVQHFKHWDMQHMQAKFPNADDWVKERLAGATSRRRQYLKYREDHTLRLTDGLEEDAAVAAADSVERATTLASSLPEHLKGVQGPTEPLMSDNISEASGTSYATSVSSTHRLRIPPLPAQHEDGPIKCPFCHMFILVHNRSDWKRHVFRDLQPYVCLREDCSVPDHLYPRRAHWMEHMKAEHWKIWHCAFGCPELFESKKGLQAHLCATHGQEMSGAKLASLESLSGRVDIGKPRENCPLCASFWCKSVQQYEEHVGRHLEDLALFALPSTGDDNGSEGSEAEENSRAGSDDDALAEFSFQVGVGMELISWRHSDADWSEGSDAKKNSGAASDNGIPAEDVEDFQSWQLREDFFAEMVLGEKSKQVQCSTESTPEEEQEASSGTAANESRRTRGVDATAPASNSNAASHASACWSVSESNDFPLLLASFGSDWNAISHHMRSKTAVMAKNYYIRQKVQAKPEWERIVLEADAKRMRDEAMPRPPKPTRYDRFGRDDSPVVAADLSWL
ncbi:Homeodomain-like protein [Cordyceps fumosorosea ARSEF 2679]|uniref:Homeodomain-like protein n=1 Tax=Cordyceps fumosorosea (strain ARSEF 2679) TaxID=1081104 RepID=A0A167RJS7_CORFA|nr:Homeodomain-like protein [Cordyceps fumosorosea ARSEF 2679]OAA58663.1 Homeodomain-like protein [Cordyceps fumosorosea ARSEF 2679]